MGHFGGSFDGREEERAMEDTGGSALDWTTSYRLVAGVYAMRGAQILILDRPGGMMIGFWTVPGGVVDAGETPQEAATREQWEEAGLTPTGPLWLVTAVRMRRYGTDWPSLRYACRCGTADVRLSHEHSGWEWVDSAAYRAPHLSDAAVECWRQSSHDEAFNILSHREGLDDFLRWRSHCWRR
jgi:8-oxo-dGTP diphosphatase